MKMQDSMLLAALIGALSLTGCLPADDGDNATTPLSYEILLQGDGGDHALDRNPRLEVFSTQASLDTALAGYASPPPVVSVDFAAQQVFLADMGTQVAGGYAVEVNGVDDAGDHAQVTLDYVVPGKTCVTTAALTAPFIFVSVNSGKPLRFQQNQVTRECS